jgi:hypothetical protein
MTKTFVMALFALITTLAIVPALSMTDVSAQGGGQQNCGNPNSSDCPKSRTTTTTDDEPKQNKRGNQDTGLIEETTTTTEESCEQGGINSDGQCQTGGTADGGATGGGQIKGDPDREVTSDCKVKNKDGEYPEGQNKEGRGC